MKTCLYIVTLKIGYFTPFHCSFGLLAGTRNSTGSFSLIYIEMFVTANNVFNCKTDCV